MKALGMATFVKETSFTGGLASRAGHPHTDSRLSPGRDRSHGGAAVRPEPAGWAGCALSSLVPLLPASVSSKEPHVSHLTLSSTLGARENMHSIGSRKDPSPPRTRMKGPGVWTPWPN